MVQWQLVEDSSFLAVKIFGGTLDSFLHPSLPVPGHKFNHIFHVVFCFFQGEYAKAVEYYKDTLDQDESFADCLKRYEAILSCINGGEPQKFN